MAKEKGPHVRSLKETQKQLGNGAAKTEKKDTTTPADELRRNVRKNTITGLGKTPARGTTPTSENEDADFNAVIEQELEKNKPKVPATPLSSIGLTSERPQGLNIQEIVDEVKGGVPDEPHELTDRISPQEAEKIRLASEAAVPERTEVGEPWFLKGENPLESKAARTRVKSTPRVKTSPFQEMRKISRNVWAAVVVSGVLLGGGAVIAHRFLTKEDSEKPMHVPDPQPSAKKTPPKTIPTVSVTPSSIPSAQISAEPLVPEIAPSAAVTSTPSSSPSVERKTVPQPKTWPPVKPKDYVDPWDGDDEVVEPWGDITPQKKNKKTPRTQ